jgi:4-hydroxybenzoate polyprenyltransferase
VRMWATLATLASIARIHIVAIGAMGTLTFAYALCGTRPWLLAAVCASDWFVVNLLNRVVDLKEDAANRIDGTELVAKHKRAVLVVGFATLLASFVVTAIWAPALLPYRLAFHALGFAYNWRLLPTPWGRVRIKELAFWKNTASATGFMLTVFCYPLVTHARLASVSVATVVVTAVFFFLFELSYEVLYDLRDVDGDRIASVRTWPVILGPRGGFLVAVALMVTSFVVVAAGYAMGVVPWRIAIMGAAPLLQLVLAWRFVKRGITSRDCIAITWLGTALLGGWHAWEFFGLPGAGP